MTTNKGNAPLPPLAPRAWLRWDVVERLIAELRPATILELGCGQGGMGARLAGLTPNYVAVEPDETSRIVASPRIEAHGGTVLAGDHTVVPAGSVYDLVCAFEVLEHLQDDAKALSEWRELVRPGGHLMLSMPAMEQRFGPMDTQSGHYRRYDVEPLRQLLEATGFTDVRTVLYGWPLGYALEAVRNQVARRELGSAAASMSERTASSGRLRQPKDASLTGRASELAAWPFRLVQRMLPDRGVGLVTVATRPHGE
jgi:SAM-dependent methyltransferase